MSDRDAPLAPRRRQQPADPAVAPRGGIEAPVRPVLSKTGDRRQRASLVAVAAIGIVVVAAGIGLERGTGPAPSGGPSGSALTEASSSGGAPTPETGPTEIPGSGCVPVEPGQVPEFTIWPSDGSADPRRGVPGPPDWAGASDPVAAWPIPDVASAVKLAQLASLVLLPTNDACFRYAVAEYVPTNRRAGAVPRSLGEMNLNPPRKRVVLGALPGGDWLLRVVAYYSTGVASGEDKAVIERFFRVRTAGPDPAPSRTPEISPSVPCSGVIGTVAAPSLQIGAAPGVTGMELTTSDPSEVAMAPLLSGDMAGQFVIRLAGDACATSWRYRWLDGTTFGELNNGSVENPGEDPGYIAQNRIEIGDGLIGDVFLVIELGYGLGIDATFAWHVRLSPPELPVPRASVNGGPAVLLRPGCGVVSTAQGRRYESCSNFGPPAKLDLLTIRDGDVVEVQVPGWDVRSWNASSGSRDVPGGFGSTSNLGGDSSLPIRFVPLPGRFVVLVYIGVVRDGVDISAPFWLEIEALP